jgi:hypothetical protein
LLELDRNVMIRTKGLPVCHPGLQTGLTIDEACKGTIVGTGEETIEVAFAENTPIKVPAKVRVLNGGEREGAITLYVYGKFSAPISGTLLTKIVITHIHNGRFGWLADTQLPQVTGGSGSVVDLSLKIGRQYSYEGRKASVLSARCIDGKLQAHLQTGFEDGTTAETTITRPCTPEAQGRKRVVDFRPLIGGSNRGHVIATSEEDGRKRGVLSVSETALPFPPARA